MHCVCRFIVIVFNVLCYTIIKCYATIFLIVWNQVKLCMWGGGGGRRES